MGKPWNEQRRKAYEEGVAKQRANRKGTPLNFTVRSGYFCYDYVNGGTLYLGRDRDTAIARALAKGVKVFEKSDSQTIPEEANTGPGGCEPFTASSVRPGWICCNCRHYTAWDDGPKCHNCFSFRCREIVKPNAIALPKCANPGQF